MRLESLNIKNFKNIPSLYLEFSEGITVLTGPNGVGKSNITDAILWVMGERAGKRLRVTDNAMLVRRGARKSEVEAVFAGVENVGLLKVRRVVTATGDHTVVVNGRVTSVKNLSRIFYDTGLGVTGYGIVNFPFMMEIVFNEDKIQQLLKESAGVWGYLNRKGEVEAQIEDIASKMQDIALIVEERKSVLSEARKEAAALRLYRIYRRKFEGSLKERKIVELSSVRREIEELEKSLDEKRREKTRLIEEISKVEERVAVLENRYKMLSEWRGKIYEEFEGKRREIAERVVHSANLKEKIEIHKHTLSSLEREFESLEKMINEYRKEKEEILSELEKLQKEFDKVVALLNEAGAVDVDSLVKEEANLSARLMMLEKNIEYAMAEKKRLEEEKKEIKRELEFLEARLKALVEDKKALSDEFEAVKARLNELEKEYEELEREEASLKSKSMTLEAKLSEIKGAVSANERRLEELREELERRIPEAVRFIEGDGRVVGVVARMIEVPSEYRAAIWSVLGARLNYIIVPTLKDASFLAKVVKSRGYGGVSFIALERLEEMNFRKPPLKKGIVWAVDVVGGLPEKVALFLLADVLIVPTLDEAVEIAKEYPRYQIVTLDGDRIQRAVLTVPSKRENLMLDLERAERTLFEWQELASSYESELEKISERLRSVERRKEKLIEELVNLRGEYERLRREVVEKGEDEEDIRSMIDRLSEKLSSTVDFDLQEMEKEKKEVEEKLSRIKEKLALVDVERLKELSEQKIVLQHRIERLEDKLSEFEKSIQFYTNKRDELLKQIKEIEEKVSEWMGELGEIEERDENLDEVEGIYKLKLTRLKEITERVVEMRDYYLQKHLDQQKMYASLKFELEELERRLKVLIEKEKKLSEEIKSLSDFFGEGEKNPEFWKSKMGELEAKGVNFAAERRYLTLLEDFSKTYSRWLELERAQRRARSLLKEIEGVINERIKEVKEKFLESLQRYLRHFSLNYTPEFEDERLILRKRGNRIDPMSLSSGEKNLYALSCLFALFSIKKPNFIVLDEVDVNLDFRNCRRLTALLEELKADAQLVVITHNKDVMLCADKIYGLTSSKGKLMLLEMDMKKLEVSRVS